MISKRLLFLLLILFFCCPSLVLGQRGLEQPVDSLNRSMPAPLRNQLERVQRGEQALASLLPLVEHLHRRDPPLAYELIRQIRRLETYQSYTKQWAQLEYYRSWIELETYMDQEELELLLENTQQGIATFEAEGDQLWLARSLVLAAHLRFHLSFNNGDTQLWEASAYAERALQLVRDLDRSGGEAGSVLGEIYRIKGNICLQQAQCPSDSAWRQYERALDYHTRSADTSSQALTLLNQAILLARLERRGDTTGQYRDPQPYYHRALERATRSQQLQNIRFEYAVFLQNRFDRRRELEWSRGAREQLQRIIAASGTHRAASFFQLTVNTQNLLAYRSDVLSEARQNQLMDSLAQLYDRTFREAQRENNLKIYDDAFNRLATLCPHFERQICSQLLATADTVKTFFIQKNKAINREITRRNKAFQAAIQAEQRHSLHQRYLFFFLLVATLGLSLFLWQRVRRLQEKVVLEQKAATIKQEALRAQMNPHFISNTINAIESLVNQGRNDEASEYLIDFSRLCRMVIEHSRYAEICLADEIDTLRYFLSLEELRLGDDLEYLLSVDPGLDTAAIRIPPLILQPFVENAIWHGIKNKPVPQRGLLQIEIKRRGKESIELVVEDNGVGRARAREIQSQSVIKQKSWGTTLTQERIAHLKKDLDARLMIEDLTDAEGQAAGTKVSIQLPLKLVPSS